MTRTLPILAALALSAAALAASPLDLRYPQTRRDDVVDVIHGVRVADPYRWLEDANKPEVKQWMAAQDRLTRGLLARQPGRARLAARLKALAYVESVSAPLVRGGRYFYERRHKDKEKAILYVRDGEHGAERVLIDPNTLTPDGTTTLGEWVPSWDGARLAYVLHANNSDAGVLHVLDVATGKPTDVDVLPGTDYAEPVWTPKGDGFYYMWLPPRSPKLPDADRFAYGELRFHRVGGDPAHDTTVHERTGDARTFVGGGTTKSGRWLFYTVQRGETHTDVWFRDQSKRNDPWHALTHGAEAVYLVDEWHDQFYVRTNEGASSWRVFRVDPEHAARSAWREIVPARNDVVLEGSTIAGGKLVLTTLHDAASGVEVRDLDGKLVRTLPLPGIGTVSAVVGDPDQDEAFLRFASFTTPPRILKTSIARGGVTTWAEVKVPADLSRYTVEQVWYPSKDGTRVSMFVVHQKGLRRDGANPFLLTGYGGFDIPMLPAFRPEVIAWLEAGGSYALANLRGGGEYGEAWHRAGMREHKQNVFDDFAAAAEYLIGERYTRPDKLAIYGRSNGGLLVGATMTQHPELFRAVLCGVPLLDMVRFHLFGGGKTWTPEYGSPEVADEFKWLYAYSPYHHVVDGVKYPALLMLSADADDRVAPLHARKFVAAMQHAQGGAARDGRPVLLRVEQHSGHAGADMLKQTVEYWADAYAFLQRELGMKP